LMHASLSKLSLVLHSAFLWKLIVFVFLLGVSETLFCLRSPLQLNPVLQLDELPLLIVFLGTLTCLKPRLFLLITFDSNTFAIIKISILFNINILYLFSLAHNGWHDCISRNFIIA
jgi:hypothetical protein